MPFQISASVQERRKRFSELLASSSSDSDNEQTPRRQLFRTFEKSAEVPQIVDSDHESSSSRQCTSNESAKYAELGSDYDDEELGDEEETTPLESEHGVLLSRPEPGDQKRSTRHDRVVQKHLNSPAHSALKKLRQQRMMKKQRNISGSSGNNDEKFSSDEDEAENKRKKKNSGVDDETGRQNSAGIDEETGRQNSVGPTLYSSIDRLPKRLVMRQQQKIHYC